VETNEGKLEPRSIGELEEKACIVKLERQVDGDPKKKVQRRNESGGPASSKRAARKKEKINSLLTFCVKGEKAQKRTAQSRGCDVWGKLQVRTEKIIRCSERHRILVALYEVLKLAQLEEKKGTERFLETPTISRRKDWQRRAGTSYSTLTVGAKPEGGR